MTDMHDGCVHRGLRYSAYLRDISPDAYIILLRNDHASETHTSGFKQINQMIPSKLFGITVGYETRSLNKIVELAIAKVREYDATVETFTPEEAE